MAGGTKPPYEHAADVAGSDDSDVHVMFDPSARCAIDVYRFDCNPGCPVEATVGLIDGKWKCVILYMLSTAGTLRFNELARRASGATARVMTTQLRELEADGLIERIVYAQVPPKVEYRLSPLGRTLEPVLQALSAWGVANIDRFGRRDRNVASTAS